MSESNNKKGNKLLKFVIIYTILIVAATVILIFLNYKYNINLFDYFKEKNNPEDEIIQEEPEIKKPVENKEPDYSKIKRTTLLDKYYINNIELKEKKLTYGNIVNYNSYDGSPIYKVSLSYIEIDGLKDKEVQNKINSSIEEKAKSLITDEEIYDDSIETIHIVAGTSADYSTADLISMPVTKETVYKENRGHEEIYVTEYCPSINYRLDTGEELKLEDLFTKDASIKSILAKTVYKSLGFDYGFDGDTGEGDLDTLDYGKIENDVYNIINSFYNQKENIFWFNQEGISVMIDNNWYSIANSSFYDYINFNNITDNKTSIYKNGDNPKINYVFARPYMSGLEHFDKVSNNSYLSIFNWYRFAGELIDREPETIKYTNKLLDSVDELEDIIKNDNKKENRKRIYLQYI